MTDLEAHNINTVTPDPGAGRETSVAVVIPVYNRSGLLVQALESLADQDDSGHLEIHVCDDGSEEDIAGALATAAGLNVSYHIQERAGFGAGRARNMGAAAAGTDLVLFLDQDCVAPPDFLARHRSWHAASPRSVLVGGRSDPVIEEETGREHYRERLFRRSAGLLEGNEIFRSFVSSNVSLPTELFREVGGFDSRFRHWGSEDTELGWRLWQTGATFLFDPNIEVRHLLDQDSSGGMEGRRRARDLNDGLLQSLVPHRFYRKTPPRAIPVTPKVSVVFHGASLASVRSTWATLLDQPRRDFELIVVADAIEHDPFAGSVAGDPRIRYVSDLEAATAESRGEYICFLDGHGSVAPGLLDEMTKRLDQRPALVTGTVGYALPSDQGGAVRSETGAGQIDRAWGGEMPLCWFIRKREAAKISRSGTGLPREIWKIARAWDLNRHWTSAAVRFPSLLLSDRPDQLTHTRPDPARILKDVVRHPGEATRTISSYVSNRREGTPYVSVSGQLRQALDEDQGGPVARYVGWTGRFNLGDDLMLDCVRELIPWAEIVEHGEPRDLILLGGGTLINRRTYLRWVTERDSPRFERATLGTGVASPDFWGVTEDTGRWIRWLSTCVYVGVRGPRSVETLRSWGYTGDVEVCGDSALLTRARPDIQPTPGRIVVSPAWTKGELWGGSDQSVMKALASAIDTWRGEGHEIVCLASSPEDDGQILQLSQMTGGTVLSYLAGYSNRRAAVDLIASSDLVIGERLHACIIAAAVSTPFVAIEYRPKLRDFAESVNAGGFVVRSDELGNGDAIREKASEAMAMGTATVDDQVALYRERLAAAGELLRQSVS
jgi:GT2 family glycosyltransferase